MVAAARAWRVSEQLGDLAAGLPGERPTCIHCNNGGCFCRNAIIGYRTATWRSLVREAPPSVLAEMLGVTAGTAMRHAQAAGADYTAYAALKASGDV